MLKSLFTLVLFYFSFSIASANSSYPLPEFEITVIESISESVHLGMSLNQIEEAKASSRLAGLKKRLNTILFTKMAPLLSSPTFSTHFNLLQIPQVIPLQDIIAEMTIAGENGETPSPADFIIMITPKLSLFNKYGFQKAYSDLYPGNKAPLFTHYEGIWETPMVSFIDRINQKMFSGAQFLFDRFYQENLTHSGFFAGAMVLVHAEGAQSWATAKIALGMPVDYSIPFEQSNEQIKLTQISFPRAPYNGFIFDMENPAALVTFNHSTQGGTNLKIAFGTLGPIEAVGWSIGNSPSTDTVSKWLSWFSPYNVPHFRGEIVSLVEKEMLGSFGGLSGWINSYLSDNFDIQLNLHEISIDLLKMEIENVKMTIDLPQKGGFEILPTFRTEDPEEQFKNEGNKVINEQKEKLQEIIDNGLLLLSNEDAQTKLLKLLNELFNQSAMNGETK